MLNDFMPARRRLAHLAAVTANPPHDSRAQAPRLHRCSSGSTGGACVVVGGLILDVQASPANGQELLRGTSAPGKVRQNPGGVGRNIAEGMCRLSSRGCPPPLLVGAVGDDLAGEALMRRWGEGGASTRGIKICEGRSTPVVVAVLDAGGEVMACVADTATVESGLTPSW